MDKVALDKYLTREPPDDSPYFERVYDNISEDVLNDTEKYSEILDQIINACIDDEISPEDCAKFVAIMLKLKLIKGI